MGKEVATSEEKKFNVLITDNIDPAGIAILREVANVTVKKSCSEDEICSIICDYNALMVRSATKVTSKIVEAGKNLVVIGRAGVGVDNVDVDAASQCGIFVVNSPSGNTVAAAEHTLTLMLCITRKVCEADHSIRNGKWERNLFVGKQLQGKTLGIVGLGQVGSHLARVCQEIGMKLLCYDPFVNHQKAVSLGCEKVSLDELLKNSDYVTIHVPLTGETQNIINKQSIQMMKKTAMIINTSRGGVVNENDLAEALQDNLLAGAALDVFVEEKPFPENSKLLKAPNLLLTPHLGASTVEAQLNVAIDVAEEIKQIFLGNLPKNVVNLPFYRMNELQKIQPVLSCCEILGGIASQMLKEAAECICVVLEGSFAEHDGDPLLLAVANGVLSRYSKRRVSFVNAKQVAEKCKIMLSLSKEAFHTKAAVRVELKNKEESITVQGTVNEGNEILLTSFDGFPVYIILNQNGANRSPSYMFYSKHLDTPGVLADITAKLAKANINIANCHLGRKVCGSNKLGCCIFHVDQYVDESVLNSIRQSSTIQECKLCLIL